MAALHKKIRTDGAIFPDRRRVVVYIGDYVDRGPRSRDVIDLLLEDPLPDFEAVYLKGNHEAMLLDFLDERDDGARWVDYGGKATLASYDVPAPASLNEPAARERLRADLSARLPGAHRAFLEGLELSHVAGDYLFVHAGIEPRRPLAEQTEDDLLWIRERFLGHGGRHEKVVVHGHSVARRPEVLANRICVDTGTYATGILTCVVLDGEDQMLLSVRRKSG